MVVDVVDLYKNKHMTLRGIGVLLGVDKKVIKRILVQKGVTIIPANHRKIALSCKDCQRPFQGRKGCALRCPKCRTIKRRLEAKERYRTKFTHYDGSVRFCTVCDTDITHHKLDRMTCDNCRTRDCSYLKHMSFLLERDLYLCAYCGTKICRATPPTIDHKIPLSRGGTNELDNLTIACRSCNCRKGTKTYTEFKKEAISW